MPSDVLSPLQVKKVRFANRIVMAPMVRFGFPSEAGVMGEKLMHEYLERADQNIGLMISQALSVSERWEIKDDAGAYSDRHIEYLSEHADTCHRHDTRFFAQLALGGFGFYNNDSEDVNTLTEGELAEIRDSFVRAAERCRKAGLDGVELHGAHTFFLNMMASPHSNKRQDSYGGDLEGRLALARGIVEGIKAFARDDFLISYRMGWSDSLEEDARTAQALESIGVDIIHVSTGIPQGRVLARPEGSEFNDVVFTACYVKKHVHVPVIAVNGIKTLRRGNELIESGCCDLVAYGRPFLADPGLVTRSLKNLDHEPCLECKRCQWFTDGEKCPAQIKARRKERSSF